MYRIRKPRHASQYRARLSTPRATVPARLLNVSASGCLLSVDGPLRTGQRVKFAVLGQPLCGKVTRDQVGRAAVAFERSLSPHQLQSLRSSLGTSAAADDGIADRITALRVMSRSIRRAARKSGA